MSIQSSSGLELAFVRDLVLLLKEQAAQAKTMAQEGDEFESGRQMAYYEVLDLIASQALAFHIDFASIELHDFDAFREILPRNSLPASTK